MKDRKYQTIEAYPWLKDRYGDRLNKNVKSVLFCQDEERVWIEIRWEYETEMGIRTDVEYIDLDFIRITYDVPLDIWQEGGNPYDYNMFKTDVDIEENAKILFEDEVTLENVTPLFD